MNAAAMRPSRVCCQADLETLRFQEWARRMGETGERYHRKIWEYCFVASVLDDYELLCEGSRGLGFAVGQEPLPALFASLGCAILATDMDANAAEAAGWVASAQHAEGVSVLNKNGICRDDEFRHRCGFRTVDMNHIPADLRDFDFTWSCCAVEHVGSIELGQQFVLNQMKCLKPGGVAVHTTELNLSSNRRTVGEGPTVLFRKRDLKTLARMLIRAGHRTTLDFRRGRLPIDRWIDVPPYSQDRHLRLQLMGYVATSIALVIEKAKE